MQQEIPLEAREVLDATVHQSLGVPDVLDEYGQARLVESVRKEEDVGLDLVEAQGDGVDVRVMPRQDDVGVEECLREDHSCLPMEAPHHLREGRVGVEHARGAGGVENRLQPWWWGDAGYWLDDLRG